ncbi:hypothetical protein AMTRI_Chr07g28410 [Amborella trichopoda]
MPTLSNKSVSKEGDGVVRISDHSDSHAFCKQLSVSNRPSIDSSTSLRVFDLGKGGGEIFSGTRVQPLRNDGLSLESDTLPCFSLFLSHQTHYNNLPKGAELAITIWFSVVVNFCASFNSKLSYWFLVVFASVKIYPLPYRLL